MDHEGSHAEANNTTPLFGAYRRGGYDPEQVDRYVADQQRRLEAAEHRASDAERRLAAAVGQLRELHRRVAVLESEDRSPQAPSLDTLGERVQRILQEAWEGAYALRQAAEQEVTELRDQATSEAEEIVKTAEERARQIDEEIERRRKAYLARLEEDRGRAVAQVSYLHEQRRAALTELLRVKELIEATVGDSTVRINPPLDRPLPLEVDQDAAVPTTAADEGQGIDRATGGAAQRDHSAPATTDEVLATLRAEPEPELAVEEIEPAPPRRPEPDGPTTRVPTIAARTAADASREQATGGQPKSTEAPHRELREETAPVSVRSLGALVSETRAEANRPAVRRLEDEADEPVDGESEDASEQPSGSGESAGSDASSVAGVFDFDEE